MHSNLSLANAIDRRKNEASLHTLKSDLKSLELNTNGTGSVQNIAKALSSNTFRIFLENNDLTSYGSAAYKLAEHGDDKSVAYLYRALNSRNHNTSHRMDRANELSTQLHAGEHHQLIHSLGNAENSPTKENISKLEATLKKFANPKKDGFTLQSLNEEVRTEILAKAGEVLALHGDSICSANLITELNKFINNSNSDVDAKVKAGGANRMVRALERAEDEPTQDNLAKLKKEITEIQDSKNLGFKLENLEPADLAAVITQVGIVAAKHSTNLGDVDYILDLNKELNANNSEAVFKEIVVKGLNHREDVKKGYADLIQKLSDVEHDQNPAAIKKISRAFHSAKTAQHGFNLKYLHPETLGDVLGRVGVIAATQIEDFSLLARVFETNKELNNSNQKVLHKISVDGLLPRMESEIEYVRSKPLEVTVRHLNGFIAARASNAYHFAHIMNSGIIGCIARFPETQPVLLKATKTLADLVLIDRTEKTSRHTTANHRDVSERSTKTLSELVIINRAAAEEQTTTRSPGRYPPALYRSEIAGAFDHLKRHHSEMVALALAS